MKGVVGETKERTSIGPKKCIKASGNRPKVIHLKSLI